MIIFNNNKDGCITDNYYIEEPDDILYESITMIDFMDILTETTLSVILEDTAKSIFEKIKEFFKQFLKLAHEFFEDMTTKLKSFIHSNLSIIKAYRPIILAPDTFFSSIFTYHGRVWHYPIKIDELEHKRLEFINWIDQYSDTMINKFTSGQDIDTSEILTSSDLLSKLLETFGVNTILEYKHSIDKYYIKSKYETDISLNKTSPNKLEMLKFIDSYPEMLSNFAKGRHDIEKLCNKEISKSIEYEREYNTKLEGNAKQLFLKMISAVTSVNRTICTLSVDQYRHSFTLYKEMHFDFIKILMLYAHKKMGGM